MRRPTSEISLWAAGLDREIEGKQRVGLSTMPATNRDRPLCRSLYHGQVLHYGLGDCSSGINLVDKENYSADRFDS